MHVVLRRRAHVVNCVELIFVLNFAHVFADEPAKDDLEHMKAVQLKALCKQHGLKVSGKKAELQDRLRQHFMHQASEEPVDDFDSMSDNDLQNVCKTRGLLEKGERGELLERLRSDISYSRQLLASVSSEDNNNNNGYEIISKALEKAAQNSSDINDMLSQAKEKADAQPKFVDVTIRSIGLTPEKFTSGGAPSATADVLRKLAGDPFEDEPRFGTVRPCRVMYYRA